ncbi:MAG: hypothetical protein ABID04_02850 [Patescibacteria group bacterium]
MTPEGQPVTPLESGMPPAFYPMAERDIQEEIREALAKKDPERVSMALAEAWAYNEGLVLGIDGYDTSDPRTLVYLMNLFTTVEGGVKRAPTYYVEQEIRVALEGGVRAIKRRARMEKRALTDEEKRAVSDLTAFENKKEAVEIVDQAFINRQNTVANPGGAAKLGSDGVDVATRRPAVAPDKGHWISLFEGPDGQGLDEVLREMVRVAMSPDELQSLGLSSVEGIPREVYAMGFATQKVDGKTVPGTQIFKRWMDHMLGVTGGRMDLVWRAWKLALVWKLIDKYSVCTRIDDDKKPGTPGYKTYVIGGPPIMATISKKALHLKTAIEVELGYDADGNKYETGYVSHGGYPLMRGQADFEAKSFLDYSKVKLPDGKKDTLWNLWWSRDENGRFLSLGSPRFLRTVWAATDVPETHDVDEVPTGSFGGYLLLLSRLYEVAGHITGRALLREMTEPDFWEGKTRVWSKAGIEGEDRVWFGINQLYPHRGNLKDCRIGGFTEAGDPLIPLVGGNVLCWPLPGPGKVGYEKYIFPMLQSLGLERLRREKLKEGSEKGLEEKQFAEAEILGAGRKEYIRTVLAPRYFIYTDPGQWLDTGHPADSRSSGRQNVFEIVGNAIRAEFFTLEQAIQVLEALAIPNVSDGNATKVARTIPALSFH